VQGENLARYRLQQNERAKLFATFLNNLAVSVATVGAATPLIVWAFFDARGPDISAWKLSLGALCWLLVALIFHTMALMSLALMREEP
jgi:hypothetical protein